MSFEEELVEEKCEMMGFDGPTEQSKISVVWGRKKNKKQALKLIYNAGPTFLTLNS